MKSTFNRYRLFIVMAAILLPIQAQAASGIVNSGASLTSSNSVVTIEAIVPHLVQMNVLVGTSDLSETLTPARINTGVNTSTVDYQIRGNLLANSVLDIIDTSLNATSIDLTDGNGHHITVGLSGTIGASAISTAIFHPTFGSGSASISINGDLDESTVDSTDPPGTYTGSVTLTATIH